MLSGSPSTSTAKPRSLHQGVGRSDSTRKSEPELGAPGNAICLALWLAYNEIINLLVRLQVTFGVQGHHVHHENVRFSLRLLLAQEYKYNPNFNVSTFRRKNE